MLAHQLLALRSEPGLLELQLALVQAGEHLAFLHRVAGAHQALRDVAVERGHGGALHFALDDGLRGHAVLARREAAEQHHRTRDQREQLDPGVARPEQRARAGRQRFAQALPFAALVFALEREDRSEQHAHGLAQLDRLRVEPLAAAALQRQHAARVAVLRERHRADRDVPEFARQLAVGDRA